MYYVYIIYSQQLNKLYKGSTTDLKKRIYKHQHKQSTYTKRANDWKLIYYQAFLNKTDALREESFLKSGKGNERIKLLLKCTRQKYKFGDVA